MRGGGFSLPGGWGGSPCRGVGGLPARGLGVLGGGGFSLPGGWGVQGGFSLPARGASLARDPPPVNRITHTCKNITLATTSLRPVMKIVFKLS